MPKILIVDNYDSFTFNLVHYLEVDPEVVTEVYRNDQLSEVNLTEYHGVVLSPGPGLPSEAGELMSFIHEAHTRLPILGVCLGMQGILEYFGGTLVNMEEVLHGRSTGFSVKGSREELFKDIPYEFNIGRYHSWVADKHTFPSTLENIGEDENGNVMALKHISLPIYGVQFHPESILTQHGKTIINNWLNQL